LISPEEQREGGLNSEGMRRVGKEQEKREGCLTDVTEAPLAGHDLKSSTAEMVIA